MVQFETKRKTSPGFDILEFYLLEIAEMRKQARTAAAWLSSARAVRCWLKCQNERNPHPMLHIIGDCPDVSSGRKEGMTSSQHGAYTLGHTHPTMANNSGTQASDSKQIPQISPQFRLESATRLHEVGIGSNRGSAWSR